MPLWIQLIIDALLIFGMPWMIHLLIRRARIKAQYLPEIRIPTTKQLAEMAAKSVAFEKKDIVDKIPHADVAFLILLKEYGVRIPSKEARKHALNATFFDLKLDR